MLTVTYHGVHQAFQLALAGQEAGLLEKFYCSLFDASGKWGRYLSSILGAEMLQNRRIEGIPNDKICEYPWPELIFKLRQRIQKLPSNSWIEVAGIFDDWASRQLAKGNSRIVVAAENCAFETFRCAEYLGMKRIYDCPGINAQLLQATTKESARRNKLPFISAADSPEVMRRKDYEIEKADLVLAYSDYHADGIVARGVPRDKIRITPLWIDSNFWTPGETKNSDGPLKVLFAGGISLRKGVPFLIEAVRALVPHVKLTMVGRLGRDAAASLASTGSFVTILPPVGKEQLRRIYRSHDILVLPSLGDSFGFVALEAMACGLPVVLTTHCGAPVPDDSWRVSVMDSLAIKRRLDHYLDQRRLLQVDGGIARSFSTTYSPHRYRAGIIDIYRAILSGS